MVELVHSSAPLVFFDIPTNGSSAARRLLSAWFKENFNAPAANEDIELDDPQAAIFGRFDRALGADIESVSLGKLRACALIRHPADQAISMFEKIGGTGNAKDLDKFLDRVAAGKANVSCLTFLPEKGEMSPDEYLSQFYLLGTAEKSTEFFSTLYKKLTRKRANSLGPTAIPTYEVPDHHLQAIEERYPYETELFELTQKLWVD
jgi:hypothetical protein